MMCVYINSYAAAGWDFFTLLYINISYKMYTTLLTSALLLQALKLWQFSKQHSTWSKLCKDDEMMEVTEQLQKYNGVVMFNQMYPTSEYFPPPKIPDLLCYSVCKETFGPSLRKHIYRWWEQKDLSRQRGQQGPHLQVTMPSPGKTVISNITILPEHAAHEHGDCKHRRVADHISNSLLLLTQQGLALDYIEGCHSTLNLSRIQTFLSENWSYTNLSFRFQVLYWAASSKDTWKLIYIRKYKSFFDNTEEFLLSL